ncbi:hypothetical protein F2Q68_00019672 [Brassica cretica]|uniref:Uncharacterized protein n=1 Tax=Brassica cretica TaxID=69181 RepID=A0A8S9FVI6_BRACR|nr:hypothetical protein F2Q68_00019672 [Brassica cretica]
MSAMFSYSPSSPPPPPRFTSCCHFSLSLQLAPLIVIVSQVHLVVAATAPLIASVFPVSHFIATFLASLVITVSPAHLVIAATPTPLLIAAPLSPSGNAGSTKLVVSLTRSHFLYFAAPPAFHTVSDCDSPWWCWLCFHHGLDLLRSSPTFSHPLCFSLTPRDSLSFVRVWAWLMVGSLKAHLQSLLTQQGPLRILVLKELHLYTNYSDPLLCICTINPKPCSFTGLFAAAHQYQV